MAMRVWMAGLILAGIVGPLPVQAGDNLRLRVQPNGVRQQPAISPGGRAPWSADWQYDSGSGNDRRPELPYYQQGGGQQTGGPARNLLPDDGLHIFPR